MFLVVELLFIALLVIVLFMLYKNESISFKSAFPQAKVEEYWTGKERRKHIRFKKEFEINYTVRKHTQLKNGGKTADISEGGVKLLIGEKLAKGTILSLMIPISSSNELVEIEGEVMWSEESEEKHDDGRRVFYSGIMFLATKEPSDKYSLISYIRSLPLNIADKA